MQSVGWTLATGVQGTCQIFLSVYAASSSLTGFKTVFHSQTQETFISYINRQCRMPVQLLAKCQIQRDLIPTTMSYIVTRYMDT